MRWGEATDKEYDPHVDRQLIRTLGLPLNVDIRPWNEDDFPTIQGLSQAEGWTTPVDRPTESMRGWHASWPALVATVNGSVVGFVRAVSDHAVTTYIAEILVSPEWRGRGLGVALLSVTQYLCPGTRIDLLATGQSRGFYDKAGFRPFLGYRRSWPEFEALLSPRALPSDRL
jgi:GNAT superfamily N-acetyltransferase